MVDNSTPLTQIPNISTTTAPLKESEPIGVSAQETLRPIEEPEISKEVVEYLKKSDESQKANIAPDLKKLGVQAADDAHNGAQGPTFNISDDKIEEGLRQPVSSSWRWLSETLVYLLGQTHIHLKKVHGHVKRFITS